MVLKHGLKLSVLCHCVAPAALSSCAVKNGICHIHFPLPTELFKNKLPTVICKLCFLSRQYSKLSSLALPAPRTILPPSTECREAEAVVESWPWDRTHWSCSAHFIPWGAWGCSAGCGPGALEAVLEVKNIHHLSKILGCNGCLGPSLFSSFFLLMKLWSQSALSTCAAVCFSSWTFTSLPLSRKVSLSQPKGILFDFLRIP